MQVNDLAEQLMLKFNSQNRTHRQFSLIDSSIRYSCNGTSPNQWDYNIYFQKVLNQVNYSTNITYQRLVEHGISLLFDSPNKDEIAGYKSPTIVLKNMERGGTVCHFIISIGVFLVYISVLNLDLESESILQTQKNFGQSKPKIIKIEQSKKYFLKRMYFEETQPIPDDEDYIRKTISRKQQLNKFLIEYSFAKICSLVKIGPKIIKPLKFDIICFHNCAEFYFQKCYKLQYGRNSLTMSSVQHRLKYCVRLLHELNIVHGNINQFNILYGSSSRQLVLFGFDRSSTMTCPVGFIQRQNSTGIDPYYLDMTQLQKTILELADQTLTLSMGQTAEAISERSDFSDLIRYLSQIHFEGRNQKYQNTISCPQKLSIFFRMEKEEEAFLLDAPVNIGAIIQSAQILQDVQNYKFLSSLIKFQQAEWKKIRETLNCRSNLKKISRVVGCCKLKERQADLLLKFCESQDLNQITEQSISIHKQLFFKISWLCLHSKKQAIITEHLQRLFHLFQQNQSKYGDIFDFFSFSLKVIKQNVQIEQIFANVKTVDHKTLIILSKILISKGRYQDTLEFIKKFDQNAPNPEILLLKDTCWYYLLQEKKEIQYFREEFFQISQVNFEWVQLILWKRQSIICSGSTWIKFILETQIKSQCSEQKLICLLILLLSLFTGADKLSSSACRKLQQMFYELISFNHDFNNSMIFQFEEYNKKIQKVDEIDPCLTNWFRFVEYFLFQSTTQIYLIKKTHIIMLEYYCYKKKYALSRQHLRKVLLDQNIQIKNVEDIFVFLKVYMLEINSLKIKQKEENFIKTIPLVSQLQNRLEKMHLEEKIEQFKISYYLSGFWKWLGETSKETVCFLRLLSMIGLKSEEYFKLYERALYRFDIVPPSSQKLIIIEAQKMQQKLKQFNKQSQLFEHTAYLILSLYGFTSNLQKIITYISLCERFKRSKLSAKLSSSILPRTAYYCYIRSQFTLCMKCISFCSQEQPLIQFFTGACSYRMKKYSQSVKYLKKFLQSAHKLQKSVIKDLFFAQANNYLSAIFNQKSQNQISNTYLQKAAQIYLKLANQNKTDKYTNHQAGACLAKLGHPKQGIHYFRRTIRKAHYAVYGLGFGIDQFTLNYSAGICSLEIKAYKEATFYFVKCLQVSKDNQKILFCLTKCFLFTHKHKRFYAYAHKVNQSFLQQNYYQKICSLLKNQCEWVKLFVLFNVIPKYNRCPNFTIMSTLLDLKNRKFQTAPDENRSSLRLQILLCKAIQIESLMVIPKKIELSRNAGLMAKSLMNILYK